MPDHALHFGSIDNFPRFADRFVGWKILAEKRSEFAAAPDSLLENRLKGKGRVKADHQELDQTSGGKHQTHFVFVAIR